MKHLRWLQKVIHSVSHSTGHASTHSLEPFKVVEVNLNFEIAFNTVKKKKKPHILDFVCLDSLPVNNDVPAGHGCPVFMKSGPTVFQYELQKWVRRLHQLHLKVQRLPQIFHYWIIFFVVEELVWWIWRRIPLDNTFKHLMAASFSPPLWQDMGGLLNSTSPWASLIFTISCPEPTSAVGSLLLGL